MNNDLFEIKKCRLKTLSPIHIGSVEQRLTPFEYIYAHEKIFFVSEEKLSYFLARNNLIEPYVRAVSADGHKFRLSRLFKEKGIVPTEKDLYDISGGRYARAIGDTTKLQDIRPIIRDGMGEVFIPGTSLKGVFKTAVLLETLKKLKEHDQEAFKSLIENKILNDISGRANKKFFFQWGMEKWFESFFLNNKKGSPNTDWFRMLRVSDAYPVEQIDTSTVPISIAKKEHTGWRFKTEGPGNNTLIWVECIPENTTLEFQLSWDKKLLEDFKKQNKDISLPDNIDEIANLTKASSISKRTTLGTIEEGGIRSGEKAQPFEHRREGDDRHHAGTGEKP